MVFRGVQTVADVEHGPHQQQDLENAGDKVQQISGPEAHAAVEMEGHQLLTQVEGQAGGRPGQQPEKMLVCRSQHHAGDGQQEIAQKVRKQIQHQLMTDHMIDHQIHGLRRLRDKRLKGRVWHEGEADVHRQQQHGQKQDKIGRQFFVHFFPFRNSQVEHHGMFVSGGRSRLRWRRCFPAYNLVPSVIFAVIQPVVGLPQQVF